GRGGDGQGGIERLPEPARAWEDPEAVAQRAPQAGRGLRGRGRDGEGEGRLPAALDGQAGAAPSQARRLRDRRPHRGGGGGAAQVSRLPALPPSVLRGAEPAAAALALPARVT